MEVYLFPCSDVNAFNRFEKVVQNEISLLSISTGLDQNISDDIKNNVGENFRLWGVMPGTNNYPTWNNVNEGDLAVFYRAGRIIATCKIKYKLENEIIAKNQWGMDTEGNTWKYLIFFDRYDGNSFNLTRNNGNPIKYQGFSKISPDIKKRVLELIETNTDSQWLISLLNINKIKLNTIIDNAFKYHKQVILTGAPGTGKTYCSKKYVQSQTNNDKSKYSFVQFHPSYDYSDFVEGLRPVVLNSDENDEPTFVRMDGVFKEFCRMVVMKNYSKMKEEHSNEQINDFNTLYKKYEDKQEEKYFFIIDEINRADLSKVFGELMYGLEESYRGIENSFNTQYKNLKTYTINNEGKAEPIPFDCFEKGFFIPKNVYIIGTMNDIDKSVESFDFALRRRFEWIEIKVKDIIDSALSEMLPEANNTQIIDLKNRINTMNEVISTEGKDFGLSEAYHIGYAYFKNINLNNEESLKEIFNHNIASILKEYTRGRDKDTIINFIEHCKQALLG